MLPANFPRGQLSRNRHSCSLRYFETHMNLSRILLLSLLPVALVAGSASSSVAQQTAVPIPRESPYHPTGLLPKARNYYNLRWGVEPLQLKEVSSGTLIKFTYRVLDANKAKILNDEKNTPYLIDQQDHVRLVIPTMEKVGQLRQVAPPEDGEVYWMVFSNKGNVVKPGARVDIAIGSFHASGLLVE